MKYYLLITGLMIQMASAETTSLAGNWRFSLDPKAKGQKERWFSSDLKDTIPLPGTTDEAHKSQTKSGGAAEKSIRALTQEADHSTALTSKLTRRFPYEGVAWYQRDIDIPESWKDRRIELELERTKLTSAWIDEIPLGTLDSLTTSHLYPLPLGLPPGKHRLTILVDNRLEKLTRMDMPAFCEAHQVANDTQTNWNGIVGDIRLKATDRIWIENVEVYPDVANKTAKLKISLGNESGLPANGKLSFSCTAPGVNVKEQVEFHGIRDGSTVEATLNLGENAPLWSEVSPALHELTTELSAGTGEKDLNQTRFGLREISTEGTQITVNGQRIMLRGTLNNAVFPLTGYAPMDKASWTKYFTICRDYGLNHVRFHTWCPPRAAFEAADECGIHIQPELANFGGNYGTDYLKRMDSMAEARRILKAYGNSPSFCFLTLGNENLNGREIRAAMVRGLRAEDPRRLFTQASNPDWTICQQNPGDDYWVTMRSKPELEGNVRGSFAHADKPLGHVQSGPANTLHTYEKAISHVTCPLISHEAGNYQVYPTFAEIESYTGILRPLNLEIFRERLSRAGMLDQAGDFFRASGALATINYRAEIETYLRTPKMGGFQLLDLQDYPGQGTALVGILDAFMESKGLITPEQWRMFCNSTVVLGIFPKYTWEAGETFTAKVAVANYGPADLPSSSLTYAIKDESGHVWSEGKLPIALPHGQLSVSPKEISLAFPQEIKKAQKLSLEIGLEGTEFRNQYPLWVYPQAAPARDSSPVKITHQWKETLEELEKGSRVVFIPRKRDFPAKRIDGFFTSDFWCYAMFKQWTGTPEKPHAPGTLGLLIQDKHPALEGFPTDFHSDYQWFDIVMNGCNVILDGLPKGFRPIVQSIDNVDRNHRLGLIFEARVGPGKLLACMSDLASMENKPEARQLLNSLVDYASSEKFSPSTSLDIKMAGKLFASEEKANPDHPDSGKTAASQ